MAKDKFKDKYVIYKYVNKMTRDMKLSNMWNYSLTAEGLAEGEPTVIYRKTKGKPREVKKPLTEDAQFIPWGR